MLVGLILRGVAFEFRIKGPPVQKALWTRLFVVGSLLTTLTQGWMLGLYVMGLEYTLATVTFAALSALCVSACYILLGSTWLIIKTDGELQVQAVSWARMALIVTAFGILAVSIATPIVSSRIFWVWFGATDYVLLTPLLSAVLVGSIYFMCLSG